VTDLYFVGRVSIARRAISNSFGRCYTLTDDNDKKLYVRRAEPSEMQNFSPQYIKCTECGDITEFVLLARSPAPIPVKRLSKDYFQIIGDDTGEVFEYQHSTDKSGSVASVRRTLSNLRAIINTNCVNAEFLRWVTLTYAENMTDPKQLKEDIKNFRARFRRYCKRNNLPMPETITVIEPQGRGAWHAHEIWIYQSKAPYIDNNAVLAPLWGHGFTKIKAVHGVDNLGAYFSAYLADIPLDEFQREEGDKSIYTVKYNEVSDDEGGEPTKKAFVKGARLRLYPSEMNIYRCSRGIRMPVVSQLTYSEYEKKKASVGSLTFSHASVIVADSANSVGSASVGGSSDGRIVNKISHEYYNKKR